MLHSGDGERWQRRPGSWVAEARSLHIPGHLTLLTGPAGAGSGAQKSPLPAFKN